MKPPKKIKFYIYHQSFLTIRARGKSRPARAIAKASDFAFGFFYKIGLGILAAGRFVKKASAAFFFAVGGMVIAPPVKAYRALAKDFKSTKKTLPRRLKLLWQPQFGRSLLIFLIVSVLGYGGIASLHLIARGLDLKNNVMQTAALGNTYLSEAKDALSAQDFSAADNRFALAYKTFQQGQQQLDSSGQLLNRLTSLLPQKQTANGLLEAAELVSSSGQDFVSLESQLKSLHISQSGLSSDSGPNGQALRGISSGITQISAKIDRANGLVNGINANSLPAANRASFVDLKNKLQIAQFSLDNFTSVFNLAQSLLLGDKTVLVLFENNNELRAGGGFIGTYGDLKIHDGQISKMAVSSIYDLDNQLLQVIQPPTPLLKINSRWYMRDANWFADFPGSARKVSNFYEMEGGNTPDAVIAMTPNLIIDLLKITGPIPLPKYDVTLTSDNFVEETQAVTTMSDALPTNSPKQILADLVPILLQKISQSSSADFPQIVQALQNNLNNKQIVLYSRDSDLQTELSAFHWTGEVSGTDRDYTSVVSSNLGATKTDLDVDQKIAITTTVLDDGSITDEVDITRANKLPVLPDTFNNSFLRVYAPLGSRLISNTGFDYLPLEYPRDQKYQIDSDVLNWEKNAVKDVVTGTYIGQESGKTFFGNWLNLNGGETRTVKLVYQLPFKLSDVDRYSLLLQKQIGSANSSVNWTFNFPGRQIAWKNFDTPNLGTDSLNSDIILDKDYFLGLVMSKR